MSLDPASIITVARLWMVVRPIRSIRNRIRAKRGLPPLTDEEAMQGEKLKLILEDGREIVREEPIIHARTSTKVKVASWTTILGSVAVYLPFYNEINAFVMQACESEQGPLLFIGGMAVMAVQDWLVARKTKSPLEPGKL